MVRRVDLAPTPHKRSAIPLPPQLGSPDSETWRQFQKLSASFKITFSVNPAKEITADEEKKATAAFAKKAGVPEESVTFRSGLFEADKVIAEVTVSAVVIPGIFGAWGQGLSKDKLDAVLEGTGVEAVEAAAPTFDKIEKPASL